MAGDDEGGEGGRVGVVRLPRRAQDAVVQLGTASVRREARVLIRQVGGEGDVRAVEAYVVGAVAGPVDLLATRIRGDEELALDLDVGRDDVESAHAMRRQS